jgi:hypothetical protein
VLLLGNGEAKAKFDLSMGVALEGASKSACSIA